MNFIKVIKALIDVTNGKKTDTGSFVTIIAAGLALVAGMGENEAVSTASGIMLGFGAVTLAIGRIHAKIKEAKKKNEKAD